MAFSAAAMESAASLLIQTMALLMWAFGKDSIMDSSTAPGAHFTSAGSGGQKESQEAKPVTVLVEVLLQRSQGVVNG